MKANVLPFNSYFLFFPLNRASFSRFGPKIGYEFSFVSSLNEVRV